MGDFLLYSSIRNYIYARISYFMEQALHQNLTTALAIITALMTLWVLIHGFMIATGRSQDGLKGFTFQLGKAYFIISMALGVSSGGNFALRTLTEDLSNGISRMMTGDTDVGKCFIQKSSSIIGCKIDANLTSTQTVMNMLGKIDTADDEYLEKKITEARWFSGIGTAGPAIVAGGMLIIFRISLAMFIGFGPIFILCLLFKKTEPLFHKWLNYGLATLFSGVMLGVMADICMDLVANVSIVGAVAEIGDVLGVESLKAGMTGVMQSATQQLGLGLLLSMLLITVPPMAGAYFNGLMATYYGSNYIERWNNPSGHPPMGSGAGSGAHGNLGTPQQTNNTNTSSYNLHNLEVRTPSNTSNDKVTTPNTALVGVAKNRKEN